MRHLWPAGLALVLLLVGLGLGPYALSVYHLEAGGEALEKSLVTVFPDRLAPEQIVNGPKLEDGAAHLRAAIRWDSRNVQAQRLLARVYLSQDQSEAALEALQQALVTRPTNPLLQLELGDVYDSLGQTVEAIQAYEAGRVGSRRTPLTANYLKLAEAHAEEGGGDTAIALWRKALAADPGNLYALYRLAKAHRAMGDVKSARVYEKQLQHFELRSVTIPLDFRLAEYQGQAMANLVEDGLWTRVTWLNVISYQVGQFSQGLSGLMTEAVLRSLSEHWSEDADIFFYQAELYHRRGQWEQAEATYRQVLMVNPHYAQAYLGLGMVAEAKCRASNAKCQNGLEESAQWYNQYHEMTPDDLLGLRKLTEITESLGKPEAAMLRERLQARTDDRQVIAELLRVPADAVELGSSLIQGNTLTTGAQGVSVGWLCGANTGQDSWQFPVVDGPLEQEGRVRIANPWWPASSVTSGETLYTNCRGNALTVPTSWLALSLWYKLEGGSSDSGLVYLESADSHVYEFLTPLPDTSGRWIKVVIVGLTPEAHPRFFPNIRNRAAANVWFQDVSVRPLKLSTAPARCSDKPCAYFSGQ
jgi:tetratricopeptide (TPR) repeat protein